MKQKVMGMFEVTDPKLMPKETLNVVGIGFRKSDVEFRDNFQCSFSKSYGQPRKNVRKSW